jgi:hypothetical protein
VQFRPVSETDSQVRRFSQMVFEISYVDPVNASEEQLEDVIAPIIGSVVFEQTNANTVTVKLTANDDQAMQRVSMLYSSNGKDWKNVDLTASANGAYQVSVNTQTPAENLFVYISAVDHAGNISVYSRKGVAPQTVFMQYLPQIELAKK